VQRISVLADENVATSGPEFAQATALHQQGRLVEAERLYLAILARDPHHSDAVRRLGVIAAQTGRQERALELFGQAINLNGNSVDAHFNLGNALLELSRPAQALPSYDAAIALAPRDAELHFGRGRALRGLQRLDAALSAYDEALVLNPRLAEAHFERGTLLQQLDQDQDAVASYEAAIALRPDFAEACCSLGQALELIGRHEQALASYEKALALRPEFAEAHFGRGSVLVDLNRYADALAALDRAIALRPGYSQAYNRRGSALTKLGRLREALDSHGKAIAINPDYAAAHYYRGLTFLALGDLEPGWRDYQWRWKMADGPKRRRSFKQPEWLGEQSLIGRTILLYAGQGFGDTIQYVRYVPLVAALGAKIVLEVQPPLKGLISETDGASLVLGQGDDLPPFDYHCSLESLPLVCKTRLDTIPAKLPYLRPRPDRAEHWRRSLAINPLPKVGLVWAGNPEYQDDKWRSIGLSRISPLLSVPGIQFVGLQKDLREGDADMIHAHPEFVQLGLDFNETAAVISQLDLVISSDTSLAHLSGALAKPLWLLLCYQPDWRWLLEREDTPWYPGVKLFRQPKHDDWESVVARVAEELKSRFCL
jgi:tetratricopeptide (TPR) repeat protein